MTGSQRSMTYTKACGRLRPTCWLCCRDPTGRRAPIYTGLIHPATITEFAIGASLYFGELIVQNPFLHPGTVKKKYSPVEHPRAYRHEFLKSVLFFLTVMPLVERGLVNLIPDPCDFDHAPA